MSAFTEAYRAMLIKQVKCPMCPALNKPGASPTIEIDQTNLRAFCTNCSADRRIEDFLQKESRWIR